MLFCSVHTLLISFLCWNFFLLLPFQYFPPLPRLRSPSFLVSPYESPSVDIGIVDVAAGSSRVRTADCSAHTLSQATARAHVLLNNNGATLPHLGVSCVIHISAAKVEGCCHAELNGLILLSDTLLPI